MKLAICNEMFENWKIEDVFDCASQLGYQAVEIAPFTLADDVRDISTTERRRLKKAAADSGRAVVGFFGHYTLFKRFRISSMISTSVSPTKGAFL